MNSLRFKKPLLKKAEKTLMEMYWEEMAKLKFNKYVNNLDTKYCINSINESGLPTRLTMLKNCREQKKVNDMVNEIFDDINNL